MIPNTLNFVWLGTIPRWVVHNIGKWKSLNPDFRINLHGTECLRPEYREHFERAVGMESKSDLVRLSALRKSGGWYFDCDFVPLRPIRDIIEEYGMKKMFISKQWSGGLKCYANGILGFDRDFDGWSILDEEIQSVKSETYERTSYGPLLVTRFMNRYDNSNVMIGKTEQFYFYRTKEQSLRAYLEHNKGVDVTKGKRMYTIHLWLGGNYRIPELQQALDSEEKQ